MCSCTMRHRFTPNLTPRGRRSTPSNSSSTSSTGTSWTTVVNENTVETEQCIPFIPPNSSKPTEDITCDEVEPSEDISSVAVVETVTERAKSTQPDPKKSRSSKENASKPTTTRRCRIKPNVTPKPRKKNKTGEDATSNDDDTTKEASGSSTTDVVVDKEKENDTSEKVQSNEHETNPEISETSTSKATKTTKNLHTSVSEIHTTPTSSTDDTAKDGKTSESSISLSRRRRAMPKICIPTRVRRHTALVSKEDTEKSDSVIETSQPQQQSDSTALEKTTTASSETVDNAAKRPRIQQEVVEDDIEVVEITVEAAEEESQDAPAVEEETEVVEEQTQTNKKMKGRKRKTPIRKPKEMLDPSRMTLQDLIYFNPKGNHMKSSVDAKRKRLEQQKRKSSKSTGNQNNDSTIIEVDDRNTENQSNNQQTTDTTDGGGDSAVCAPQVKIGADGCIILDEESLVIRSPANSALEDKDIIYEDASDLNFDFCTKLKGRKAKWSIQETIKFYKALSQVGTDFQLMTPLFPLRSRKELKAKFKKEEKTHFELVDKALVFRTPISLEMFLKEQKNESTNSKTKEKTQASNATNEEPIVIDS